MAHDTPFLPGYNVRLSYSAIQEMCKEFELETIDDLPTKINSGKLKTPDYEKIILFGLNTRHPEITLDDLKKPGGMFDKFMDINGTKGINDLVKVALDSLYDCGILVRSEPAGDMGEASHTQSATG